MPIEAIERVQFLLVYLIELLMGEKTEGKAKTEMYNQIKVPLILPFQRVSGDMTFDCRIARMMNLG